jgi:hypothetical protein
VDVSPTSLKGIGCGIVAQEQSLLKNNRCSRTIVAQEQSLLKNNTRKSRTAPSRAVVSQQTLVAIPVMMHRFGIDFAFTRRETRRISSCRVGCPVHDRRAFIENACFDNRVKLSQDAEV